MASRPVAARINRPTICLFCLPGPAFDDRPRHWPIPAAIALELIHCASLGADDLPLVSTTADFRRGNPTVHPGPSANPWRWLTRRRLIYRSLLTSWAPRHGRTTALRALTLVRLAWRHIPACRMASAAGQGWESEAKVDLRAYHMSKTAALFVAATQMGAMAAGQDTRAMGRTGRPHWRGVPGGR